MMTDDKLKLIVTSMRQKLPQKLQSGNEWVDYMDLCALFVDCFAGIKLR